jgi:hypothetical protein
MVMLSLVRNMLTLALCLAYPEMCCNRRWSKYTPLDIPAQERRPQASSSLPAYLRIPQSLCSSSKQDARISTRTLSVRFPPPFLRDLFAHLRSHVRDIWKELFKSRFRVGLHDRAYSTPVVQAPTWRCHRSLKNTATILRSTGHHVYRAAVRTAERDFFFCSGKGASAVHPPSTSTSSRTRRLRI